MVTLSMDGYFYNRSEYIFLPSFPINLLEMNLIMNGSHSLVNDYHKHTSLYLITITDWIIYIITPTINTFLLQTPLWELHCRPTSIPKYAP